MTSFCFRRTNCVICILDITFSKTRVVQLMVSKINFCQRRSRSTTSYHVRKLKNGSGWLFVFDTWSRYIKKFQFMHTETRQISNLRSADVSKGIQSDLVRKDVTDFNDKFYHFQNATPEMFEGASTNYSMLMSRF